MSFFCNGKKGPCDHDEECRSTCEFFDGRGGYYVEIVTNGDRVRAAKSDEEMAGILKGGCPPIRVKGDPCFVSKTCKECWLDWLRQPAEEGDGDG